MAITTKGAEFITGAITGAGTFFNNANTYIGVGDGSAAATAAQTDLVGTNKFRKKADSGYPTVSGNRITLKATFEKAEANFAWNEWGVFNAATGGTMLCRVAEVNGTKLNNQTWAFEVVLQLSAT